MTTGITHDTAADGTYSAAGKTHWEAAHLFTESGGQALTIGAIANGQGIKRSGTSLLGYAITVPSDIVYAAAPNTDSDLTAGGAGGLVNFLSQSVTGVIAGDQLICELWYTILNNSGSNRTYTPTGVFGGFTFLTAGTSSTVNASATNRTSFMCRFTISISSTSLAYGVAAMVAGVSAGAAAGAWAAFGANPSLQGFGTTTSDMTGTNTLSFGLTSSATTATQTLTLHSVSIRKISAT